MGLRTWRRQLKGNTEYELARRYLRCVFALRDSISGLRAPFVSSGEMSVAVSKQEIKTEQLSPTEATRVAHASALQERWNKVIDAHSDFAVERLEAEALWGDLVRGLDIPLEACVREIGADLWLLLWYDDQAPPYTASERGDRVEIRKKFFYHGDEDQFSKELSGAIKQVEAFMRPRLRV